VRREALGDLRFFRVLIERGTPAAGCPVRELALPRECILVSVRRAGSTFIPRGDTLLEPGDCVFVLGREECVPAVQGVLSTALAAY
jgi:Trk K+ transport system NAD-binding subunit